MAAELKRRDCLDCGSTWTAVIGKQLYNKTSTTRRRPGLAPAGPAVQVSRSPGSPAVDVPLKILRILNSRIDAVTFPEALERIRTFLREPIAHHLITGNTLMLLDAQKDPELRAILENAALVVPESSGILWASRRLGAPLKEFIPGIELMLALCQLGAPIYLLGAKAGIAEEAARELRLRIPGLIITGTQHGYFPKSETTAVIERIRGAAPTFLFVGMSVPGQEKWIAKHMQELNIPVVMGVGGSFDVLCGRLNRAPEWMRRLGIEWLYRLLQEPWRWRRIARLPVFAAKILYGQFRSTL